MVEYIGDPSMLKVILKSTDRIQGVEKTTRAMDIVGLGVLVIITTQSGRVYFDTTQFIPGAELLDTDGVWTIVKTAVV